MSVYKIINKIRNRGIIYLLGKLANFVFSYVLNLFTAIYYSNFDVFTMYKHKNFKKANIVLKYNRIDELRMPNSIVNNYINHNFDILGTGLINYNKSCDTSDFYLNESAKKLRFNLSPNYSLINWTKDPKSLYTWPNDIFHSRIKLPINQGVDVKFIWELGRLQHLPQLALAAIERTGKDRDDIVEEIKNQLIDFVIHNKPYFGTNWTCAMDVSIRAINIITTIELLGSSENISLDFMDDLDIDTHLYIHGRYILSNLEWFDDRNNHYLSNLCGLIYISTYLQNNSELNIWLGFAISQLFSEVRRQFNNDGSNFEGSVSYHALSIEILLHSYFRMSTIKNDIVDVIKSQTIRDFGKLPINRTKSKKDILRNSAFMSNFDSEIECYKCTIINALKFLICVSDENYRFPLIGDNDNGTILNLNPLFFNESLDQTYNSIRGILTFSSKFSFVDLDPELAGNELVYLDLFDINRNFIVRGNAIMCSKKTKGSNIFFYDTQVINNEETIIVKHDVKHNDVDFEYKVYSDFGIIVWKSNGFTMTLRSITKDIEYAMCHFHMDQLSINLVIDGVDVIVDPGTPSYTGDILLRNYYRSHFSHHGFNDNIKDNSNPFSKLNIAKVHTFSNSEKLFHGQIDYKEFNVDLKVEFSRENISIVYKYIIYPKFRKLLKDDYGRVTPYKSYGVFK